MTYYDWLSTTKKREAEAKQLLKRIKFAPAPRRCFAKNMGKGEENITDILGWIELYLGYDDLEQATKLYDDYRSSTDKNR